jgi:Inner membrane protein import complex subunit Tim54
MSFILKGVRRFWFGSGKPGVAPNRHAPPWPSPRAPRFYPTPLPKPTTLIGKIKSYIPGRNWLIFGGFVGSWVSLAYYDRSERKKAVEKWCRKVEHLGRREIGYADDLPSVGVWIAAPPGDQLRWNKEVWRYYVKVFSIGMSLI